MTDKPIGELEFLRKLQRLLDEGEFVATYKLALLTRSRTFAWNAITTRTARSGCL